MIPGPDGHPTLLPLGRLPTLLRPTNACSPEVADTAVNLLVVVTSAVRNYAARQAARDTWARDLQGKRGDVQVVFLLGLEEDNNPADGN